MGSTHLLELPRNILGNFPLVQKVVLFNVCLHGLSSAELLLNNQIFFFNFHHPAEFWWCGHLNLCWALWSFLVMSKPTDKSEAEFWCGGFAEQQPEQKINVFPHFCCPGYTNTACLVWGKGKPLPNRPWDRSCRCHVMLCKVIFPWNSSHGPVCTSCTLSWANLASALKLLSYCVPNTGKYLWNKWMWSMKPAGFGQCPESHVAAAVSFLCPWISH